MNEKIKDFFRTVKFEEYKSSKLELENLLCEFGRYLNNDAKNAKIYQCILKNNNVYYVVANTFDEANNKLICFLNTMDYFFDCYRIVKDIKIIADSISNFPKDNVDIIGLFK